MNEKDKTEISADLNRMLMEMYDRGISDAGEAAIKAIESAILAEREACAKVCDKYYTNYSCVADKCATAIRARGGGVRND